MNKISENAFALDAGDAVESIFAGRSYKKVPEEGDEPCVFAYTKACDFLCGNGTCACLEGIWAEDTVSRTASGQRKKPLARCRHCGRLHTGLVEVEIGDGNTELWCPACRKAGAKECPRCGKIKPRHGFYSVEGSESSWCADCCEKYAVKCPRCNRYAASVSFMTPVVAKDADGRPAEQLWCRRCERQAAVRCSSCGKPVDKRHAGLLDGGSYLCPTCLEDQRLSRCRCCGTLTRNAPGLRGDTACDSCRELIRGSPIRRYHDFPFPLLFWDKGGAHASRERENTLYLGFELEAGGATVSGYLDAAREVLALDPEEERFHQEHDSTIPEYGFELISAPHTLAGHLDYDWEKVLKIMVKRGLRSHDLDSKCGLHVHVSRSFLTGPDMAKIDLFILKNKIFWEKIARRSSGRYTQYPSKPIRQHGRSEETAGRYAAVNFCNASTVEFRIFRGTLNYASLIGTLAIVDGVCRWVKTRNSVQILKNDGETDRFYAWLKDNGPQYAPAVAYIDKRNALSVEGEL